MKMGRRSKGIAFCVLCISLCLRIVQGYKESETMRNLKLEQGDSHEVHCSRERSQAAWKIIEEYLMPFVEKERYQISRRCKLHPDNDLYRDQEQHKIHVDLNEWQCGYCRKRFYTEKYLDLHFDNRHYDLLNMSHSRCLADVCGALHCDLVMDSMPRKTKCNPAAAARNHHLCESLADGCFPVNQGPSASHLHEFFLRQFCDAHTCTGGQKPFSRGHRVDIMLRKMENMRFVFMPLPSIGFLSMKTRSIFYLSLSILTLVLLPLFYIFIYMHQRGIKGGTVELKRISKGVRKKKPS